MPKILVVEDDPETMEAIQIALRPLEHTVISARTGEEALNKVMEERPDLALLDINLPDIEGYLVCQRIRATPEVKDMGILFFTARQSQKDTLDGLEVGADDYVSKPVHPEELRKRVQAVMRRLKPTE